MEVGSCEIAHSIRTEGWVGLQGQSWVCGGEKISVSSGN